MAVEESVEGNPGPETCHRGDTRPGEDEDGREDGTQDECVGVSYTIRRPPEEESADDR